MKRIRLLECSMILSLALFHSSCVTGCRRRPRQSAFDPACRGVRRGLGHGWQAGPVHGGNAFRPHQRRSGALLPLWIRCARNGTIRQKRFAGIGGHGRCLQDGLAARCLRDLVQLPQGRCPRMQPRRRLRPFVLADALLPGPVLREAAGHRYAHAGVRMYSSPAAGPSPGTCPPAKAVPASSRSSKCTVSFRRRNDFSPRACWGILFSAAA